MKSISLKLPDHLEAQLAKASQDGNTSRSEIVRAALEAYFTKSGEGRPNCLDLAGDLVGSLEGPRDLSANPKHLKGYGS